VATAIDPDRARQDAHHILSDRRFQRASSPRPFRSPLRWLGDRLHDIGDAIAAAFRWLPGPTWVGVAIVLTILTALLVAWITRQRTHPAPPGAVETGAVARVDPGALERAADEAERAGDYGRALRLRFQAGLLRLDGRGVIRYRPSLTTNEVRRMLGSETFDELAARFEEVAYGGRDAHGDDVAAARTRWPTIVEHATRR